MNFKSDYRRHILNTLLLNGQCIAAEIYRLADSIPSDFVEPTSSPFNRLLVDFAFFENRVPLEKYVEQSEDGKRLDQKFYEQFSKFLKAFSSLLNALCAFIADFSEYAERARSNVSNMQNAFERRHVDAATMVPRCEALFIFGLIILLLDAEFSGCVKERIFVALYRSGIEIPSKNFELIVSLLRKRKENYETCFRNFKINAEFVDEILAFLNSATNLEETYFSSEKISTMLYVCLYFRPEILESNTVAMRQIVDQFFADKWIIALHLSLRVNVREKWAGYRAANSALSAAAVAASTDAMAHCAVERARRLMEIGALPGGLLSVKSLELYARLIVQHNDDLRWLILHSDNFRAMCRNKKSTNAANLAKITSADLITALAKLAYFEYKFRQSCKFLIRCRSGDAIRLKARLAAIFEQIITFLASPVAADAYCNDKLRIWLITIRDCVAELNLNDSSASQILEHLRTKIQEVTDFYADEHLILRQYLILVIEELSRLSVACGIDTNFLERVNQRIYAFYLGAFVDVQLANFEALLKRDAPALKFIFMKMSAVVDNSLKLVCDAEKRYAISTFYHRRLETQLKRIIQVIPRAIFAGMDELEGLFPTSRPIQITKTSINEMADLNRRQLLAKKTAEITKLSLGISEMRIRRLGSVEIHPNALLFDGLERELNARLRSAFCVTAPNIVAVLNLQTRRLREICKAFLFVCEYVGVSGARVWRDALTRIIGDAFAEASVRHLSANSLIAATQPTLTGKNAPKRKIFELLVEHILIATNPMTTGYEMLRNEWWSNSTKKLEFSIDIFAIIENWLPGLALREMRQIFVRAIIDLLACLRAQLERSVNAHAAAFRTATSLDAFIDGCVTLSQFQDQHYKPIGVLLLRLGQLRLIEENLFYIMDEKMRTGMEGVTDSTKNLLRIALILKRKSSTPQDKNLRQFWHPLMVSKKLHAYFADFQAEFLQTGSKLSQPDLARALFYSIFLIFRKTNGSFGGTKRSNMQHADALAITRGYVTALATWQILSHVSGTKPRVLQYAETTPANGAVRFSACEMDMLQTYLN